MAIFWQGPTHPNGGVECKGGMNNKLSCRRVTTRWFVLLNILLTHSRWLKVIRTGTIRNLGCGLLFAFHSNYGSILHDFRDKARYWSKIAFSYPLAFDALVRKVPVEILPCRLVRNKNLAIANRSRVSCAHNTLRAAIGINITPWPWNLG